LPTLLDPRDDSGYEPLPDADQLEIQDRAHVKQVFPSAPEFLIERLVKANRRRRKNLAHLKDETGATKKEPSIHKTSRFSRGAAREFESVSSFESPTTFVPPQPPRAPVDLKDDRAVPSKCPYCSFQVALGPDIYHKMDEDDWVTHFYLDLQPYLCTFQDCSQATKIFGAKTECFQHELDYHRSKPAWLCAKLECRTWFDAQEKFKQHLKSTHQACIANADVKILADNCKRLSLDAVTQGACLLCGFQFREQEVPEWRDHISCHLEQIALTALGEDSSSPDQLWTDMVKGPIGGATGQGRQFLPLGPERLLLGPERQRHPGAAERAGAAKYAGAEQRVPGPQGGPGEAICAPC